MLYRLRRSFYHLLPKLNVELVYVHNLKEIKKVVPKVNLKVFKLTKHDIERIWDVKKLSLKLLIKRLERGDACYVTEIDGEVTSYHWVQFNGKHFIQQAGYDVEIKSNEIWIYHTRVKKNYRGYGINGLVLSEILFEAKGKSHKRAWIYTKQKNKANRKGLEKIGFVINSKIFSLEINRKFYQIYKA